MTRSRLLLLTGLALGPLAVLTGLGCYHLWATGNLWVWWPLLGLFALAYGLAWRWTRPGRLPPAHSPPPPYWTDRDRRAWQTVEDCVRAYEAAAPEQIGTARHYADLALSLAADVGRIYNPDSDQPYDHLTLPEVLACIELVAADLDALVRRYVPAIHLIRLRDVRTAQTAYEWYKAGQAAYWAGATALDPLGTGLRYLAVRTGLGWLLDRIRANLLRWFHAAFIRRLGHYLIELHSGRLKVGVRKYRELTAGRAESAPGEQTPAAPPASPADSGPRTLTLAVLGPVNAGKSGLVNALLGRDAATADRLPVPGGSRYRLTLPDGTTATIHDTSGYGEQVNDDDFAAAVEAARHADLILLVTPALSPGRAADLNLLDRLAAWYALRPQLRMPPVIVAVSYIDLLSPRAEWLPPYDWQHGTRPKEQSIRECLAVVREQFGSRVADVVPVCTRAGDTFGIVEGLLPAILRHLDEARGAATLKEFEEASTARPWDQVADQLSNLVAAGLTALADRIRKKTE